MGHVLLEGDCLQTLKDLPDNSIDSVVTDPPYGLSFMGKKWDYDVPSTAIWVEVLRVLKPGGHLLSFGGTRTYHRMVVAIEDAGFEIRDQIQWIYGSGFPKSHDISKAIGKANDAESETRRSNNDYSEDSNQKRAGRVSLDTTAKADRFSSQQFIGWGTALKPANEPIVLARKPLEGTVAKNALRYGTGGLNIDASRVGSDVRHNSPASTREVLTMGRPGQSGSGWNDDFKGTTVQGRWPANVLFDEDAAAVLDEMSGDIRSRHGHKEQGYTNGGTGSSWMLKDEKKGTGKKVVDVTQNGYLGGASRFFYVAKASKRERNAGCESNGHPTVKPLKLMQYLIRLITPEGGTVLDPFMGSGSTGAAAVSLGFDFIGCELSPEYMLIAEKRIEHASKTVTNNEEAG